jgi:hypothetical protein
MPTRLVHKVLQRGYETYHRDKVRLMFCTTLSAAAVAATTVAAAAVAAAAVATTGWNHKHTSRYD